MSTLVERLRRGENTNDLEAADEIERLEADLQRWIDDCHKADRAGEADSERVRVSEERLAAETARRESAEAHAAQAWSAHEVVCRTLVEWRARCESAEALLQKWADFRGPGSLPADTREHFARYDTKQEDKNT